MVWLSQVNVQKMRLMLGPGGKKRPDTAEVEGKKEGQGLTPFKRTTECEKDVSFETHGGKKRRTGWDQGEIARETEES